MRYLAVLLLLILTTAAHCVDLKKDYPRRYVIKKGDSLWSIANLYLKKPWEWQKLWQTNPQIKNPNRLYEGSVIVLNFYKQKPYLKVLSRGTVKLSPGIRKLAFVNPVPAIPLEAIKPFLTGSLIMDANQLINAPYVVAFKGQHLIGGQGDEVYVKNLCPAHTAPVSTSYAIYRPSRPYYQSGHHFKSSIIGYKATLIGYGELSAMGDPATVLLTDIVSGVRIKDRVMFNDFPEFNLYFHPKTPVFPVKGTIIDIGDNKSTQGAVGLIVILDKGQDAGLEAGDVLAIYSKRRLVHDPVVTNNNVLLPPERVGEAMVFRTFMQTSLALVVRSIDIVHLGDAVVNP